MKVDIYSTEGKVVGQLELADDLYIGEVNHNLLHQVVNAYIQNAKSIKKASTKTRGDVSGSGAKPWKQKGSGRARVGEKRNPLWKKGGIVFGPHPRYVYRDIPAKMKLVALKYALRSKIKDQQIVILDTLSNDSGKTKDFAGILDSFKVTGTRVTFVDAKLDKKVVLSSRNIQRIDMIQAADLNAYTALNCKKLIVTKDAVKAIEARITKTS